MRQPVSIILPAGWVIIIVVLYCAQPALALDCSDAIPIHCNNEYIGNSSVGKAETDSWCYMDALMWPGNEVVFRFQLPETSDVSITLLDGFYELDIFLIDLCEKEPCIGWADKWLEIRDLAAGEYYFVLDGPSPAADFHVRLECRKFVPATGPLVHILVMLMFAFFLVTNTARRFV